jgi:hypothetical protein
MSLIFYTPKQFYVILACVGENDIELICESISITMINPQGALSFFAANDILHENDMELKCRKRGA